MDVLGLLLTLALGLLLAYAASVAYCAWILTHPPRRNYAWAVARSVPADPSEVRSAGGLPVEGLAFESWSFVCNSRQFPVWDITGLDPDGPVVIFTHGWGDSRVVALPRLAALARLASRVLAWDLPGHGEAPGACQLGSHESTELAALVERVLADAAPPHRLILAGSSLGAGVSIEAVGRLGAGLRPRAVLAEAPYRVPIVPARNVMRAAGLPWRANLPVAQMLLGLLFAGDPRWPWGRRGAKDTGPGVKPPFDRALWAKRLADLGIPLLVLHGDHDNVCPVSDGRDIADAAGPLARLVVIEGGEHNDLWTRDVNRDRCVAAVADWLRQLPSRTS